MTVVNEPGLYTLILSSRKPEAKTFKRWITHDVIPMIRKTGCYMTDSVLERIRKDPTFTYTLAKAMLREKDRADALEAELNAAKPKADYYDAFVNPYDCTNIRTTAKELKIPERIFVRFLLAEGYMFRSPQISFFPTTRRATRDFFVRDFVNHRFTGSQTFFHPQGQGSGSPSLYALIWRRTPQRIGRIMCPSIATIEPVTSRSWAISI